MLYDVLIIGGSYAGLSAALPLARARQRILIVDAGERRNRFAATAHGFLTQDGAAPGAIAQVARDQVLRYPGVVWQEGQVVALAGSQDRFAAELANGLLVHARRIVLAAGVRDRLPDIPGLAQRWGRAVFHCPYCHGYELDQGPLGVLATSDLAMHHALMLPDWGPTTLFLNDAFVPDAAQGAALQARGVAVVAGRVKALHGESGVDVVLADDTVHRLAGVFTATTVLAGPLPQQLGCAMDDTPMGSVVRTDAMRATSVAGVFACGDVARAAGSVPLAVGDGAMAGAATHRSLMLG